MIIGLEPSNVFDGLAHSLRAGFYALVYRPTLLFSPSCTVISQRLTRTRWTFSIATGVTSCRSLEPQRQRIGDYKVRSSAHENKFWLYKYARHVPEELLLSEGSMTYFFEESVRCVPGVGALRRFNDTISYSAQRLRRPLRDATHHPGCREGW